MLKINLQIINQDFSICSVEDLSEIDLFQEFLFISRTDEELSVVLPTESIPSKALLIDSGWKSFRIVGVLDFSLVGILAKIASLLADDQISIFAISTYNTDYILVKEATFAQAKELLEQSGYTFIK